MTNPRVDIIIPCYNTAKYLAQAIDSALEQTYPHINVLVVDDGSTDGTRRVVKSYGDRVSYLYQENKGLPGARNTGISHTEGEYVCFLDADDIIFPSNTADQVSFLLEHPNVDIVHGKTLRVCGSDLDYSCAEDWRPYARWKDYLLPLSVMCPFSVHSALVRRRVFSKHGMFPSEMITGCEDWAFWLKCALEGAAITFVPKVRGFYRQHDSAMCFSQERIAQQESALMRFAVGMFGRYGITEQRKVQILTCGIRFVALKWLSLGRPKEFLELVELARTVSAGPGDGKSCDDFSRVDLYPLQYLFLAEELYDLGVPELAIACLVQAGDMRTVREAAGRYGCLSSFDEAMPLFKKEARALMDQECRNEGPYFGDNQLEFSQYGKLERELPRGVSFYSYAFLQFSLLSESHGQLDQALADVQEAITHNPNFPYSRLHLAKLLVKTGSYRLAASELEKASFIDSEAVSGYFAGAFRSVAPDAVRGSLFEGQRADRLLRRMFHVVPFLVKFIHSIAHSVKQTMERYYGR